MLKILFLSGYDACRSQMVVGFMRAFGADRAEAFSAGVSASALDPRAVKGMAELGIDISSYQSQSLSQLGDVRFDLIVTIGERARNYCGPEQINGETCEAIPPEKSLLFIGVPVQMHWRIEDPISPRSGDTQVFRKLRDKIKGHVESLLEHGFLEALAEQRDFNHKLMDSLEDGIVAHDAYRRIYLFNRAAEAVTGMTRDKVLGRDCHLIFPPDGLCGSDCGFAPGTSPSFEKREYQISLKNRLGEEKKLKVLRMPIDLGECKVKGLLAVMRDVTEVNELRWQVSEKHIFHGMVAVSRSMQEIFETIRRLATSVYPVLIMGESGTGKEMVANAIHRESRRKNGPFVPINCGALPESILESELFGHVRGAFTGAIRDKRGRFELADRGTIFLDEVGEMAPAFQVKLLRVLEEKRFEKVGGEKSVGVDVRVISATNSDLADKVRKGGFREDLFYRLSVVRIQLPALRERREDIPLLVDKILEEIRTETEKPIRRISNDTMDLFMGYPWPGNIRELINALQFASIRCNGEEVLPHHLPPEIQTPGKEIKSIMSLDPLTGSAPEEKRRSGKITAEDVERAMAQAKGNKVQAAKILGVGRATLYRFLRDKPVS